MEAFKDYVFKFQGNTYRMFLDKLILKGFDAFLLRVPEAFDSDSDDYLAAHCIADNRWYQFDTIYGKRGNELYTGMPDSVLNKTLEYIQIHEIPPIEEQSAVHARRIMRVKEEHPSVKLEFLPESVKKSFATPKEYLKTDKNIDR